MFVKAPELKLKVCTLIAYWLYALKTHCGDIQKQNYKMCLFVQGIMDLTVSALF